MSELLRTILIMSLSGGVIAVLLFALKPLVRDRLPKFAQYYLWIVVIAALLVPVSKMVLFNNRALPVSAMPIINDTVSRYVITVEEELDMLQRASILSGAESPALTQEAKEAQSPLSAAVTLFVIAYPFGVLIVLLYVIISNKVFTGLHRRRNRDANAEETAMLAELCGRKRTPRLYRNPLAATPMLFGVFRPMILLPDREYTNDQLRAVLLHELTHLRHKDILIKWLSVFACAVHWFNPIVWLVRREIGRACELACDEAVVRNLDADGRQSYGETLLAVAADSKMPSAVFSTTMCEEKKALKERLGAILKSKKHTRVVIFVSVVLILAVGGVAVALGAGRGESLIEMEIVEVRLNEHGTSIDIKWGDRVYSDSGDLIQGDAGSLRGKQIGYGRDSSGTNWKIYECKGYASEEYIIVRPGWIMSTFNVFKAAGVPSDRDITLQQLRELAAKGDALKASDLPNLRPSLLSSTMGGYNPTLYGVEGGYRLLISFNDTMNPDSGIRSTALESIWENSGSGIDIRYNDVDEFIRTHPSHPADAVPSTTFEPRKWVDFYGAEIPGTSTYDLMLDEFPKVLFSWTSQKVTAGAKTVIEGTPVWNVYLADLNGDNLPELCATVSIGSRYPSERVIVYDVANGKEYQLNGQGVSDFRLSIENERLIVMVHDNPTRNSIMPPEVGSIAIINNELVYTTDRIITQNENSQIGAPTPAVRVRMDDRNIHVGDTDEAVELIYEDTHYRYSLTSTRSDSISLGFEDGQLLLLKDALSQQKISMEDLILNGLQVIIEPKDNPMGGSFNYYPLGRWSLNEYDLFPSNHFMYMTNEPGGELSAYFAVDELIEFIESCGYADEARHIREVRSVWSSSYVIEGIEYVKDSHLEAWGMKVGILWPINIYLAPVHFSFE